MELLFKTYSDRPSRVGVTYMYPHQAVIAYELLLTKGASQQFDLRGEIVKNRLTLVLTSEQNGFASTYKDIDFKPEQLRKLMSFVGRQLPLQFVHIYKTGNAPFVAKPFEKEKFISVSVSDIIIPGYSQEGL